MKNVNAILCSDIHLRETQPTCRTDNFFETQFKKLDFISELQQKYDCPVLHGGDLFHHWKPSPYLISMAAKNLPINFHTVYGQHDLPQHSLELKHKSGIYTLDSTLRKHQFHVLESASWGQKPDKVSVFVKVAKNKEEEKLLSAEIYKKVLVWHKFNYIGKKPWPDCTEPKAHSLLHKYPQFDLILTGDNHKPFVSKYEGRLLVNPGSMTRQDADQIDFKPRVYLWNADKNEVEAVYLPIEEGVVVRTHIDDKKEKDEMLNAFIAKLNTEWETTLSFEDNLERFITNNKLRKEVVQLIYQAMETEK